MRGLKPGLQLRGLVHELQNLEVSVEHPCSKFKVSRARKVRAIKSEDYPHGLRANTSKAMFLRAELG